MQTPAQLNASIADAYRRARDATDELVGRAEWYAHRPRYWINSTVALRAFGTDQGFRTFRAVAPGIVAVDEYHKTHDSREYLHESRYLFAPMAVVDL